MKQYLRRELPCDNIIVKSRSNLLSKKCNSHYLSFTYDDGLFSSMEADLISFLSANDAVSVASHARYVHRSTIETCASDTGMHIALEIFYFLLIEFFFFVKKLHIWYS